MDLFFLDKSVAQVWSTHACHKSQHIKEEKAVIDPL